MDGSAIKQMLGLGRKRRHTVQTSMSPWAASSRIASPAKNDVVINLHDNRRISNSQFCGIKEEDVTRPQHDVPARRSRNAGKLEPIKSYLRLSNVEPRHSHVLPRLNDGDEYTLGNLAISKSTTYQVTCDGETFKGFQHIFLDDRSTKKCQETFYIDAIRPLVGGFVNNQRNVCILLHGAEGSGRDRTLFGDVDVHPPDTSTRRSSSKSRFAAIPAVDTDDVSSLGCDGVSDIDNLNFEVEQKECAPPIEVSFKTDLSSCCSKLDDDALSEELINDQDGILPRLLAETFKRLRHQYPSFISDKQNSPLLVPKSRATSNCRLQTLSEVITDDKPNVSVEFYTGEADSTSSSLDSADEGGILSVRISCVEIIDDLASGECTVNDLLEYYKVREDDTFPSSRVNKLSGSGISANHIRHDAATGIVYVEDAVEMQCQSYAAAMECLAMAEEFRQTRASYIDQEVFTDKLYHAVYLLNLEHQSERNGKTTISNQIVIPRIDESMSESASLALHSSYLALNSMIDDIAKFPGTVCFRHNALTKLLDEAIGGECCTVAIGTVKVEDGNKPLPTLRLGQAMSWIYNTSDRALNVEPPKNEPPKPATQDNRALDARHSLKSQMRTEDFVPVTNHFDGPKRLSQTSNVSRITISVNEIETTRTEHKDLPMNATSEPFIPAKLTLNKNDSRRRISKRSSEGSTRISVKGTYTRQRIPTKSSQGEDSSRQLNLSLGSNSYCSFSMSENELAAADPTRNSFVSSTLAVSDNPFVKQYAKELNKSWVSRSSNERRSSNDLSTMSRMESAASEPSPSYDPVKDAKLYLAEMEMMEMEVMKNPPKDQKMAVPRASTATAIESSWRDMVSDIENNMETARKRMMDRMKEHSTRKQTDYTMILPPVLPHDETFLQRQFPPEYVSVELSSHGSSERHQVAIDELEETYRIAVSDMQQALRAVQAEKDELIRLKNDQHFELQSAREDINRLKALHSPTEEHNDSPHVITCDPVALYKETLIDIPEDIVPIQVILRVRPLNKFEQHHRGRSLIHIPDDSRCIITSSFDDEVSSEYNFDKVLGPDSTHQQVYSSTAEACLPKLMSGVSCWILLYGLSRSGKSYTLGTSKLSLESDHVNAGIIPRFTNALFLKMRSSEQIHTFTIKCSVVGLYLEQLYDLLNPQALHAPFLCESSENINIVGATEAFCFEEAEVVRLFQRGNACRDSLAYNMNMDLSYFHTFFVITLDQCNAVTGERKSSKMWFANISASQSMNGDKWKTESRIFQRSLGILDSLVDSLDGGDATDYRASKLSLILNDAFAGSSFATSIITASPSSLTLSDTLKALDFGKKMQRIKKTAEAVSQLKKCSSYGAMDTDDMKSKYMSTQSELIVWRQRADSLTRKALNMEQALQKFKKLLAEKNVPGQSIEICGSRADGSLNTDNYDMHSALSFFDDDICDNGNVHQKTDSITEHEVETKSVNSKSSIRLTCSSSYENPSRKKCAAIFASMTTAAGTSSFAEIEEADKAYADGCTILNTHKGTAHVDFSNADAFYFTKEIEESYPKMKVLRGTQPFKYRHAQSNPL